MRTLALLTLTAGVLLTVGGCGGSSGGTVVMDEPVPAGAEGAHVVELNFTPTEIVPNHATLKAGEKVLLVLKNTDQKEDHNLVGADVNLKEILVKPQQTVRRLWTVPTKTGEYVIGCTIHPEIRMKIMIQ